MATFGRPLLQRFGGFSQTGRADGISPPVGGGRTQPAFPQLRLPAAGGGTAPTTLGRPQAAILGDRQAAFQRPPGPAITPQFGRPGGPAITPPAPGQPLQPTPPAPGVQPQQQQLPQQVRRVLQPPAQMRRVQPPAPFQQIQPPAPSQQIQRPGVPQQGAQAQGGGFVGGFGPGSQFDIRARLQQQQQPAGLMAPQQGLPDQSLGQPGSPLAQLQQRVSQIRAQGQQQQPGLQAPMTGPQIQPPAPFQGGGAQFGQPGPQITPQFGGGPGPQITPQGPQPPGFIGGGGVGPQFGQPQFGRPGGPGITPGGPQITPPGPGVPGREFDPTGGGLTLGGNPLIPPGTEAIGLQNLGGLIERQLASPSRFDTAAFQQSFGVGQQELQQQAELARQRATTSAAGRGVLFGTPLTGNLVDIETGLQQAQSQFASNLLLEQARTGGQDINRAIQTGLQFGGQQLGAQQFAAQLGLQQLGLGLQGAPDINAAIAAFGGGQFPQQFGGGGGGFGQFAGELAGRFIPGL